MKHRSSIIHEKDGTCYLCMKLCACFWTYPVIHEHHVFGGANRRISEEEGFKVYLCLKHHADGPEAVHNNIKNLRVIQQDAQRIYEQTHTRNDFMRLIGRNYLNDNPAKKEKPVSDTDISGFIPLEQKGEKENVY